MQRALFAGKKGVSQESSSKKNNANNKGNCCHGGTIYSLPPTLVKRKYAGRKQILKNHYLCQTKVPIQHDTLKADKIKTVPGQDHFIDGQSLFRWIERLGWFALEITF